MSAIRKQDKGQEAVLAKRAREAAGAKKPLTTEEIINTLKEIKKLLLEGASTEKLSVQVNKLEFSLLNLSEKDALTKILNNTATHTKLSNIEEAQFTKIIGDTASNYINAIEKKYTAEVNELKEWFIKDSFYSAAVGLNEINIKSLYTYNNASEDNLIILQKLLGSDTKSVINKELYENINHSIKSFADDQHLGEPKKYVDLNDNLQKALNKDAAFKNEVGDKYKLDQAQKVFKSYEDLINGKISVKDLDTLKTKISEFSNINEKDVVFRFFVESTKTQRDTLELFKNNLTSDLQEFIDNKKSSKLDKIGGAGIDPAKLKIINKIISDEKLSSKTMSSENKIILEKFMLELDKNIKDILKKELEVDKKVAGANESVVYKQLQESVDELNKAINALEKDIETVMIPKSTGTSNAIKNLEEVNANIKKLVIYNGDKDKIEAITKSVGNLSPSTEKTKLENALEHIKTAKQFEICKDKLAIENSIKNLDVDAKFTGYDDFINKDFTVSLAQHISSTVIKSLITKDMTTQQFKDALSLKEIAINADLQKLTGVETAINFTNGKVVNTGLLFSTLNDLDLSSTDDSAAFKLTNAALIKCKEITDEAIKVLEGTIPTDKLNEAHWQDAKINLEHAQKVFDLILNDSGHTIKDNNAEGLQVKEQIQEFTHLDHDQIHLNDEMMGQI